MTYQVPTINIPQALVVGDYWQWRVPALGDYPASSWTLSFGFGGPNTVDVSTGWTITAESGGSWLVQVTKAQTAKYTAGRYKVVLYVTSGSERYQVDVGWCVLQPNLGGVAGDQRSHAQKMLALCEAALEGRILTQEESYAVGQRSMSKTPIPELLRLRGNWAAQVWRELNPGVAMPSVGVEFHRAS